MKLLQINTTLNSCSHGRIAEGIGAMVIAKGHNSYFAAGYCENSSSSKVIKIGSDIDRKIHALKTRLFDRHGFGSQLSTIELIERIEKIDPDIIHLHNIHGYYLHIGVLFNYLKSVNKPVMWTFHDCWPFTGHCSHFDRIQCYKWHYECFKCPNRNGYPKSWLLDNSRKNYRDKAKLFTGLRNLIIITPSEWLARHVKNSFLKDYQIEVINNGIDLDQFKPIHNNACNSKYNLQKKYVIGVANVWTKSKGLEDFKILRNILDPGIDIVLVGLSKSQAKDLPKGIKGIVHTENITELAELYSSAYALVNPTYADNFPSVNLEALACGTPIVTYDTGGSPESVTGKTGIVVAKGDIGNLKNAIEALMKKDRQANCTDCRETALKLYGLESMFDKYFALYRQSTGHELS